MLPHVHRHPGSTPVRQWLEISHGRGLGWDEMFAGFQVRWTGRPPHWRELAGHYPGAKVILTVETRTGGDSVSATIFARALAEARPLPLRRRIIRWLVAHRAPDFALYPQMARATMVDRVFSGRIDDRKHAIEVFERHLTEVRATIPADRLLVFDVADGWPPLCEFLGVPVPGRPFPRSTNAKRGIRSVVAGCSGSSSSAADRALQLAVAHAQTDHTTPDVSDSQNAGALGADHTFAFRRSGCARPPRGRCRTPHSRPARVRLCRRCRQLPRGLPAVRRFGPEAWSARPRAPKRTALPRPGRVPETV